MNVRCVVPYHLHTINSNSDKNNVITFKIKKMLHDVSPSAYLPNTRLLNDIMLVSECQDRITMQLFGGVSMSIMWACFCLWVALITYNV